MSFMMVQMYIVEYGDVHTSPTSYFGGSLGTYRSFIDSGVVKINFIPDGGIPQLEGRLH